MASNGGADETTRLRLKIMADTATTASVALAKVGIQLGLYKAMGTMDEFEPAQLAERTGTLERYVREWLINQAAAGYVSYNSETCKFYLSAAQKDVVANEASANYIGMQFPLVMTLVNSALRFSADEMCNGKGVPFTVHDAAGVEALGRFTSVMYKENLVKWIKQATPAHNKRLDDGEPLVFADVGCGYGGALRLVSKAFNKQHVLIGFDYDISSVEAARRLATEEATSNCLYEKADAHDIPPPNQVAGFDKLWSHATAAPNKYDVVLSLNTLHDLPDPLAALLAVRAHLEPTHGTLIVVEPMFHEAVQDNFNVRDQFMSAASVTMCTPCGMCPRSDGAQKLSVNLGAFAPEPTYEKLAQQANFSRFGKVPSETHRVFVYQV